MDKLQDITYAFDKIWGLYKAQNEEIEMLKQQVETLQGDVEHYKWRAKVESRKKIEWRYHAKASEEKLDTWIRAPQPPPKPEYEFPKWITKWPLPEWLTFFENFFSQPLVCPQVLENFKMAKAFMGTGDVASWYETMQEQRKHIKAQEAKKKKRTKAAQQEQPKTSLHEEVKVHETKEPQQEKEDTAREVKELDASAAVFVPQQEVVLELLGPTNEDHIKPELSYNGAALIQRMVEDIQEQYCEDNDDEVDEEASELYQEMWDILNKAAPTHQEVEECYDRILHAKSNCSHQQKFLAELLDAINQSKGKIPLQNMQ